MNNITRRDFLDKGAVSLLKLSLGLYLADAAFPWPAHAKEDQSIFDNFPIPEITSASEHYLQQIDLKPAVSARKWRLAITGEVKKPLELAYYDFNKIERFSILNTLKCIGDPVGGKQAGHARWEGVRLRTLLRMAKIRSTAKDIVFHAVDGYSDSIPAARALGGEVLLAINMNGKRITKGHGFPIRAIVPNIYGMKNVKWIDRIEVTSYDYQGYWQKQGWSETAEIKTFSTILKAGISGPKSPALIAGVAYAGSRGISAVQISVEDGPWENVILKPAMSKYSWNLWAYKLESRAGSDVTVKIRAVERNGDVQQKGGWLARAYPDGVDGYHTIRVTDDI